MRTVAFALATLATGALAVAGSPAAAPSRLSPLRPFAPLKLAGHLFGPYHTASHHGYERADTISPMTTGSYAAFRRPNRVGVQFFADAPQNLRRDGFALLLRGPAGTVPARPARLSTGDLWSRRLIGSASAISAAFLAPKFDRPPDRWRIERALNPPAARPETAYGARVRRVLNAYRRELGEQPTTYDPALASAAAMHARYLAANGYHAPSFHFETAGRPGFTGKSPWARDNVFGWPSPLSGEVGIEWTAPLPAVTVVASLIDTVYHRLNLLSANLLRVGEGQTSGQTGAMVMDLGYGYVPGLPAAVVYPYPGQVGVATAWRDLEEPDPMPNGFGGRFGYPVTVDVPTAASLSNVRVRVQAGTLAVAITIDRPGTKDLDPNQVGLVPNLPLAPDTVYTVRLRADVTYQDGVKAPLRLTWRFATGGSDQSVSAVPAAGAVQLLVARAGSGTPAPLMPVEVLRVSETGLTKVSGGTTDRAGMVTLKLSKPGRYLAVASTGNAMAFSVPG